MAGVYDKEHGTPWHDATQSKSCKASPEEIKALRAGIESGAFNPEAPPAIEGIRYTSLMLEQGVGANIKSKHEKSDDRQLVRVFLGGKFILLGAMKGPAERSVTKVVDDIGNYLNDYFKSMS